MTALSSAINGMAVRSKIVASSAVAGALRSLAASQSMWKPQSTRAPPHTVPHAGGEEGEGRSAFNAGGMKSRKCSREVKRQADLHIALQPAQVPRHSSHSPASSLHG